jgi:hypothetical protein
MPYTWVKRKSKKKKKNKKRKREREIFLKNINLNQFNDFLF